MLKLIGILIGSALAVAFLIIALGVPELTPSSGSVTESSGSVTEPAFSEPDDTELVPVGSETDTEPESVTMSSVTDPEPDVVPVSSVTDPELAETEALIEQIFNPDLELLVEENWYAFWSPFRSEIAANGFVSKLQETTGIDYRVVKVKTGVYEVAFAYVDDADIQDKLARISDATGLNMTDG